jgi:XrtJ-associated TM-motif-TM protein
MHRNTITTVQKTIDFGLLCRKVIRKGYLMKRSLLYLSWSALLLLVAVPLHAQTGCEDSPENPTVVLAIVGSAGALISTLRARSKARRGPSAR